MVGNIAYGVVGGLVGVLYLVGIGLFEANSLKIKQQGKGDSNILMEERPMA